MVKVLGMYTDKQLQWHENPSKRCDQILKNRCYILNKALAFEHPPTLCVVAWGKTSNQINIYSVKYFKPCTENCYHESYAIYIIMIDLR